MKVLEKQLRKIKKAEDFEEKNSSYRKMLNIELEKNKNKALPVYIEDKELVPGEASRQIMGALDWHYSKFGLRVIIFFSLPNKNYPDRGGRIHIVTQEEYDQLKDQKQFD